MNNPEDQPKPRTSMMSGEAIIGTGITIAAIGVLFLLLGWAQALRELPGAATMLFIIGVVLVVAGGIGAMMGRGRK